MSALQISLALVLGIWIGYRLGTWWARRSLDRVMAEHLAKVGYQPSAEFLALLRRPTVDGVARRTLRKMGLSAYADVLLGGTPITLVCHNKALLQRAVDGITSQKAEIESHMALELAKVQMQAMTAKQEEKVGVEPRPSSEASASELAAREKFRAKFHAPPIQNPPPAPTFKVLDGGAK